MLIDDNDIYSYRSTQLCVPPGLINRAPPLAGVDGIVSTAGWQVTLCDPMWHVISCSGEVILITKCYFHFSSLVVLSIYQSNVSGNYFTNMPETLEFCCSNLS